MAELLAVLDGETIGRVTRATNGALAFEYDDDWRRSPRAMPLSLSMPPAQAHHAHEAIDTYLWGLLPDNERVLSRWATQFHVSARSAFSLLQHVGEDCAGAVQYFTPARLQELAHDPRERVTWISTSEVGERLRALYDDSAAWRRSAAEGQFSLAGAQPKTALLRRGSKWGIPSGRTPTTHILKPPVLLGDGHAENEYFCLALARAVGLPAAHATVERFDDQVAIVVERFDRVETADGWRRVHQEDMCQALSISPTRKYQNEGGPGAVAIVELLRTHSSAADTDIRTFLDALMFNWLIAGTDAHAKNYGVLIAPGGVRLAPLYDLGSALPYPKLSAHKLKMAMKIGSHYRVRDLRRADWDALASACRIDPTVRVADMMSMATRIADAASDVATRARDAGLGHPIIATLVDQIGDQAAFCRRRLSAAKAAG